VIDEDGSQLGIMPPSQALMLAEEKGLDLVEIAATASPPVCRIMNSGKFFYQQSKRESEARKHQRHIQVKEVKFRPKIDEHDFQFKRRNVERFLSGGNKVKSVVIFRGREVVHMEVGRRHLERLAEELGELCNVESPPKKEGNTMVQILAPKKDSAAKKAAAEKKAEAKKPESGKKARGARKAAKTVAKAAAKKATPVAEKATEAKAEAKETETAKKGGAAKTKKTTAKKDAAAPTRTRKTAGQPAGAD
jgi:translation initiation factor IF-3